MEKFQASEELSRLAKFCKQKYDEADLLQHNWSHIVRNIYRVEKIAETEENVDMEVLYAATMLHDIGFTVGEYEDYEENSRKVAREKLPELGFSKEETEKVLEVLEEFEGEKEIESIEAKILSDADKLEKSSLASIGNYFSVHMEWGKDPKKSVENLSRYKNWRDEGFHTEKAEEINKGGIQERIDFLNKFREKLEEREDFKARESDLKLTL
jgi:uncharacterized protein